MDFLVDNDVVYKLAAFNLLEEAVVSLGLVDCTVCVLNTLRYQAGSKRLAKRYGEATIERVISFANQQQQLDIAVTDTSFIDAMDKHRGLDIGEMQLLSALVDNPDSEALLTGDKNFLVTLSKAEEMKEVIIKAQGRFICLEQIILCILHHFPFDQIKATIAEGISHDTCIRTCFGGLEHAIQSRTIDNLVHQIDELSKQAGGLLIDSRILVQKHSVQSVHA